MNKLLNSITGNPKRTPEKPPTLKPFDRVTIIDEPTVVIEVPGDESELNQYEMGYQSFLSWLIANREKKYKMIFFGWK